jgi:hypothetical protein
MARLLGHRQTKGAATDKPILPPPRHIPTLPTPGIDCIGQLPAQDETLADRKACPEADPGLRLSMG